MATKVTFDTSNRIIGIGVSPVNGQLSLNVNSDIYSDGKDDWLVTPDFQKMRFPVRPIGGDVVSIGQLGATYILEYGWRIDPSLDQDIEVGLANNAGAWAIKGTGVDEGVAQSGSMPSEGKIHDFHLSVRTVGTPTDSLRYYLAATPGGTALQEGFIDGDLISGSFPSGHGYTLTFSDPILLASGDPLYFCFERTGVRDEANYYEIATDNDVFAGGTAWKNDNSSWVEDANRDIVVHVHIEVPYQLTIDGNVFTSDGQPVVLATSNVNVNTQVSTLVEVVQTGISGLTTEESQALIDIDTNVDALTVKMDENQVVLTLLRRIVDNKLLTDPVTGIMTLYSDDGTTAIREWDLTEDVAGTQTYRGNGAERREVPRVV